jgi:hypothetical protein
VAEYRFAGGIVVEHAVVEDEPQIAPLVALCALLWPDPEL